MSNQVTEIGSFASLYVNNGSDTTAMTVVGSVRTEGATISEAMPTEYVPATGLSYQSDLHVVQVTLSFLGESDQVVRLARGLNWTAATNSTIGTNYFSVLLISNNLLGKTNYYFPNLRSIINRKIVYAKNAPTITQIVLQGEVRDPYTNKIIYRDTYANLAAIMGTKAPF